MSASTGDVLYDHPFSFPPASIAFCRGRAKRDPSVGAFWSKPDETNRYGCEENRGYYPCRMVACFPLDVIAHGTVEEIVKQMNRADHQDDEEA